jgi:hypothetical protein
MQQPIVFSCWMGQNAMSSNREQALLSIVRNVGCAHVHVTHNTISQWTHPEYPLHPAFPLLSDVHKSDYFRSYLLHVYGGGYSDIKHTTKNWLPFFRALSESEALGLGYEEVGAHGVAPVGGALELEMKQNFSKLVGFCSMIFRPRTIFTRDWYHSILRSLDFHYEGLSINPARHPQDHLGASFTDGSISNYPIKWTEIGGDIFHPLVYRHHEQILKVDIAPSFQNYR